MATTTFMDKQQTQLLKKFYTLLGKAAVGNEGKEAILHSYGVESSKDLTAKDLLDICDKLAMQADPKLAELDRWRKRVIAAVFGYLNAMGKTADVAMVKAIVCRAAKHETFNHIPLDRLNSIYNAFKNRKKDIEAVGGLTVDVLINNVNLN